MDLLDCLISPPTTSSVITIELQVYLIDSLALLLAVSHFSESCYQVHGRDLKYVKYIVGNIVIC